MRKIPLILVVAALVWLVGCTPPGPRALLQGDELLRGGQAAAAIVKLEYARDLMPDEPRVWNLLGLAYHRAGQPALAVQAYRQALAKDRSNVVAVAHYNLGCLLLEQNYAAAAVDELRSFTLTTNSAAGLIKLGTAQLHLRQLDSAEKSFAAARQIEPRNSEALNGIGVVHAQRYQRDAAQYFSSALQSNPKYAPALLNAAVFAQQSPSTKAAALQYYRDYLVLQPKSPQAETVRLLVRHLESELAPVRPAAPTNATAQVTAPAKTNIVLVQPTTAPVVTSAPPRPVVLATNPVPPIASIQSNAPVVPAKTNPIVARTNPPLVAPSVPVTVVTVTNEPAPRIAAATPILTATEPPAEDVTAALPEVSPAPVASATEAQKKPGFFSRLNPFRGRQKPAMDDTRRVVMLTTETPSSAPVALAPAGEKPVFPRYGYTAPPLPRAGDRGNAQRAMQQATKAARAGNTNEALLDYQLAVAADPSYFDAQYNGALLAMQAGDLKRALGGWEMALALEPDSLNARYNFALALKQANYAHDAANELEKIIEAKATDVRAHLTLANLYAQQLNEMEKARAHYQKVLELEPRNPQAPAIRFWLAANP